MSISAFADWGTVQCKTILDSLKVRKRAFQPPNYQKVPTITTSYTVYDMIVSLNYVNIIATIL